MTVLFAVQGQERTIKGRVVEGETGDGLPGVTVLETGTSNGAITDIDGNYTLSVSPNASISVSYIGFETQTITVGTQTTINVTLEQNAEELQEVVVVGYGTQKKSELTGSIVSIDGESLKKVPVSTVAESLTGRLAGVQVTSTEGSPDAEIQIRVRGGSSLTQSSQPLFIVDGFPVSSISDLSPSDIESIDILKDASSTAIYGSRGANGVVIVSTKGGKAGKTSVSFNSFYTVKKIAKTLDVLDPADYVRWQYEYAVLRNGFEDDGSLPSYETYFGNFEDIDLYNGQPANDWQNQIYGQIGSTFSNDLSIRGGSDKFNYSANFARFDSESISIGSSYLRNNITLKFNSKPVDNVQLNFSLRYSDTEITGGGANEQNEISSTDSRLKNVIGFSPIPIPGISLSTDTDESLAGNLVNPLVSIADNDRLQERKNYNISGKLTWDILDALSASTSFTVDNYNYLDNRFYGVTTFKSRDRSELGPNRPSVIFRDRKELRLRSTNLINYDVYENESHNLKLLLGNEMLFTQSSQLVYDVQNYPSLFTSDEAFKLASQGVVATLENVQNPDDKLVSFFTRLNYDFQNKYLLSATYRADGSSRFLGDNVWGYFPSVSAGWTVTEESFMSSTSSWLDALKLRTSYGIAGNNNIPTGQTSQVFLSDQTNYLNDILNYWAPSSTLANPDLKWETTVTKNVGVDFGLLEGRVNGSVELYKNNTKDLLVQFPLAGAGGYNDQYRNIGEIENKGLEVSLGLIPIDKEDYGLSVNFNVAFNRNKVISLGSLSELTDEFVTTRWASTQIQNDYIALVGSAPGLMYGYVSDGRYEVDDFIGYDEGAGQWILKDGVADSEGLLTPMPGMMKLADINGDSVITLDDRRVIGNANPKHTGGIVLNAYAYGFDLTAAFNWSYGNDIYNANKIEFTTANLNSQYKNLITVQEVGSRWTNIDQNTGEIVTDPDRLAAMNENTTMWSPYMDRYIASDWAIEDGSFLRLNTVSLGYTLPKSLISKARIESLRFYATGYNLFVWTNYSGFDPEVSTRRRSPLTPGTDFSAFPRSRQFTVGMNLTF